MFFSACYANIIKTVAEVSSYGNERKENQFLGDSITEGSGTSCEAARFTCVLKEIAGLSEIRNYGIGGTRIARQLVCPDTTDFCARFSGMEDDADAVVVFCMQHCP